MFDFNRTCQSCITDKSCGYCFIDGKETSSGSCLPVWKDHPERYAYTEHFNGTFRCNETNYNADPEDRLYVWADSFCPSDYTWMVLLGLAMFVMAFAPGKTIFCVKLHLGLVIVIVWILASMCIIASLYC